MGSEHQSVEGCACCGEALLGYMQDVCVASWLDGAHLHTVLQVVGVLSTDRSLWADLCIGA
jgi:hypothetical protein